VAFNPELFAKLTVPYLDGTKGPPISPVKYLMNGPVRPETFSRQSSFIDPQSYLVANTSEQFPETPGGLPPTQTQSAVQSVGNSTSNLVDDLKAGTVDLESGSALTGVFREGMMDANNLPTYSSIRTAIDAGQLGKPVNIGARPDYRSYNIAALDSEGYGAKSPDESFEPEGYVAGKFYAARDYLGGGAEMNEVDGKGAYEAMTGREYKDSYLGDLMGFDGNFGIDNPRNISSSGPTVGGPSFTERFSNQLNSTTPSGNMDLGGNDGPPPASFSEARSRADTAFGGMGRDASGNTDGLGLFETLTGKEFRDTKLGQFMGYKSNDDDSSDSDNSRVICTELYKQGKLDMDLYRMDIVYTAKRLSPITVRGYHHWAVPMVVRMRSSTALSNLFEYLTVARAKEIARIVKPEEHKRTLSGFLIKNVGEAICFAIGLFVEQKDWSVLYNGETNNG
tara:strand:- start:1278 stop:2630 length:1353 start_codon:yes stop_codon:yes gene_type:complete